MKPANERLDEVLEAAKAAGNLSVGECATLQFSLGMTRALSLSPDGHAVIVAAEKMSGVNYRQMADELMGAITADEIKRQAEIFKEFVPVRMREIIDEVVKRILPEK